MSAAEQDQIQQLSEAVDTFIGEWRDWQNGKNRPEYPDIPFWDALGVLFDAFSIHDRIPGPFAEVATNVDRLCEAQKRWDAESYVSGNAYPPDYFWQNVEMVEESLKRFRLQPGPKEQPTVKQLMDLPQMTAQQVCRMYKGDWLENGDWDRPRVDWVQAELDKPGSIVKDHPPEKAGGYRGPDFVPLGPSLRNRKPPSDHPAAQVDYSPEEAELQRLRDLCDANGIGWHPQAKPLNLSKKLKAAGVDPEGQVAT